MFSHDRERDEVSVYMNRLGLTVLLQPDERARPERMTWYEGQSHGRRLVTTITRRRVQTGNAGTGNRHANAIVLTVMLAAHAARPFGFGAHAPYESLADKDPNVVFPVGHPGQAFPPQVKQAFCWFARGLLPPGHADHRKYARHLRIVDTQKLAEWLPSEVLIGTPVVVVHDLPLKQQWQSAFDRAVQDLGWVAHAIEQSTNSPQEPRSQSL